MAELNLYRRFLALFPAPAVEYGQVIESTADAVTVELHQGGTLVVLSAETWSVGAWVWVRRDPNGWTLSAAPALSAVTVEV